jgi:hypothetical protein
VISANLSIRIAGFRTIDQDFAPAVVYLPDRSWSDSDISRFVEADDF